MDVARHWFLFVSNK